MKNHFYKNLKVIELLKKYKPKFIVELGANDGANTRQYIGYNLGLKDGQFKMVTIDDREPPNDLKNQPHYKWVRGISYIELWRFPNDSIDFCSIDTDHNYWTLREELKALKSKLKNKAIVIIHDVEINKISPGFGAAYSCNIPYPALQITLEDAKGKHYPDAISEIKQLKKIGYSKESSGAIALMYNK